MFATKGKKPHSSRQMVPHAKQSRCLTHAGKKAPLSSVSGSASMSIKRNVFLTEILVYRWDIFLDFHNWKLKYFWGARDERMPDLVCGDKTISLGEDDVTSNLCGDISALMLSLELRCCGLRSVLGNRVCSEPPAILLPYFSQNYNKMSENVLRPMLLFHVFYSLLFKLGAQQVDWTVL